MFVVLTAPDETPAIDHENWREEHTIDEQPQVPVYDGGVLQCAHIWPCPVTHWRPTLPSPQQADVHRHYRSVGFA